MRDFFSGSTVVIQIRSASTSTALKWLKGLYPKLKIIYDVRGATAEEYVNKYQRNGSPLSKEIEKAYLFRLNQELSFLDVCDKAFCVSNKLKEYFLARKNLAADKFEVVPGCADESIFFPDNAVRDRTRRELGITEDRVVLLYSGGLDQPWQIPDFVFRVVSKLQERNGKIFFMCLTPHQEIVAEFVETLRIEKTDFWSGYIRYQDINAYLNAADVGLLFREDNPTNNVASPTKFAEYLMAGLPTLISKGVGDLSGFVEETPEAGLVVNNDSERLIEDIADYLQRTKIERNVTAGIGKRNFSKRNRIAEIVRIYESLC